jgi:DNA polymerase III epsilon subunit-like protein
MRVIFFDTETTGNTPHDFLCQLAIKERGIKEPLVNAMYKPCISVPIEASMVHNITNKMLADKPCFKECPEYKQIKALFEDENTVAVAHNAQFDVQILKNDDINVRNFICTFKVIRAFDGEGKYAMHKLQYLRYALDMELDVPAHDAYADVLVLEQLFEHELVMAKEKWQKQTEEEILNEMIAISALPLQIRSFDFGKYRGKTVAEVASMDPGYLSWLLDQKKLNNADGKESDWIATLEKHLGQ